MFHVKHSHYLQKGAAALFWQRRLIYFYRFPTTYLFLFCYKSTDVPSQMFHVKHRDIFIAFMAKKNSTILINKDNEVPNFS